MFRGLAFYGVLLFFSSCAAGYEAINPSKINYESSTENQDIEFSYRYDVLNERGNRKYAKKENLKEIKLVAVKIVNNSSESFLCGDDYFVRANGIKIKVLEPDVSFQYLRQISAGYLFYILLTPLQFYSGPSSIPIGLVLGPVVTIGNFGSALSANNRFKEELQKNYVYDQVIEPGDTIYGIIGITKKGYHPLTLE